MRDYLLLLILSAAIPVGLFRPYYGVLVYAWISYMYPHELTWGFARTLPAAKLAALATAAGIVLTGSVNLKPLRQRENVLMILLWGIFTFSSFFAINSSLAWSKWNEVSKLIVMALLTAMLLTDEKRIRYFFLLIAFSLGFYGLKGGLFGVATGGQFIVWGPGTSVLAGNNAMGLALNMTLPFLWYLGHQEKRLLKILLYSMFVFTIPAVMFTYSRASGIIALPIVLVTLVLKGRKRFLITCAMLLTALLAYPFIPQRWWNRQRTVLTYESDTSAMSRIDNWKVVWRMANDRPLTGGGFLFHTDKTIEKYGPEFIRTYGKSWDTHNIFVAILGAHGFPGLLVFTLMIGFCFLSCRRLRRAVRKRPDLEWVGNYCRIVEVSFLALLINGMFVNMEYFDLLYHLVAMVTSLKVVCYRALSEAAVESRSYEAQLVPAVS
jgi:probable O-glycosylation ligase (exosortase A-associated)